MNNRDYKQHAPGLYCHIYNRGVGKGDIFKDQRDYAFFVSLLKQNLFPDELTRWFRQALPPNSFSLICYCLMPNHFHLLLRQDSELPLSKLMLRLCTAYSIYFNKKYKRVGHVFQGRYKQAVIEDNYYLIWISAYIHQNPTVAGLVRRPEDYQWSSYDEYIRKIGDGICGKSIVSDQFKDINEYKKFVDESFKLIKRKKEAESELEKILIDF